MKKIILLAIFFLIEFHSYSQCNFISDINFTTNFTPAGYKVSGLYNLPANYKVYNQIWKENGNTISNSSLFDYGDHVSAQGINELCLASFFTDTITGDSCTDTHCEIVSNEQAWGWANIDVDWQSGLDIQLILSYPQSFNNYIYWIDFGDSSSQYISAGLSSIQISHSYSQNGSYTVSVGNSPFGLNNYRTINIGSPNLKNIELPNYLPLNGCDTNLFVLNASDTNVAATVFTYLQNGSGILFQPLLTFGDTLQGKFYIPGTIPVYIQYQNFAQDVNYTYPVVVSPSCIAPPDTIYGFVWNDINFNGLQDVGETGLPNATINVWNYNTQTDSSGNYSILVPHIPTSLDASLSGYLKSFPAGAYNFNFQNGTGHYNFDFGFAPLNQVCGKTFIDVNNDSIFITPPDYYLPSTTIQFRDTATNLICYSSTNQTGDYCAYLPYGNYITKPVNYLLDSALFFPDSILINQTGSNINNQNFIFTSNYSGGNFNLTLTSNPPPRHDHYTSLITRVENTGIDSLTGTLSLKYDTALVISSILPGSGVVDTANYTITWNTGYLKPASSQYFTASYYVPINIPIGYIFKDTAQIISNPVSADHDSTNNIAYFSQVLTGPLDPNDKSVYPFGYGQTGDVHHETRLNYRINFQNVGTASAINVIVQDTIDADLDLNTFQMNRTSHTYSMVISNNIITWKFLNINLPDSNTNVPLSHGFIEYSIKPKQGLPDGTTIENSADIYFDFNSPITTNTTLNTLQTNITSIKTLTSNNTIQIFPNPSNGNFKIIYHLPHNKSGSLQIIDITGKEVYDQYLPQWSTLQFISLPKLSNGVYAVKINADNFSATKKLLVQQE